MLSWLFGKKSATLEMSPPKAVELEKLLVPREDIMFLIEVVLTANGVGGAGIFYAIMQGYENEVILASDEREFDELVTREPEFKHHNIRKAVQKFVNEIPIARAHFWEHESFTNIADPIELKRREKEMSNRFSLVTSEASRIGPEKLLAMADIDLMIFLPQRVAEIRQKDISYIVNTLNERKSFLKPLLLRAKARSKNKYGEVDLTPFTKELDEFIGNFFSEDQLTFFYHRPPRKIILEIIEGWMQEVEEQISIPEDGVDFEHWCAEKLRVQGWNATVSQASGDQGVDIIATKDDFVVAIQCKRYSKPIGNKAIQEAYTGKQHYNATVAVVVGTGGFTRSAQALALNTGVLLIDAENISDFTQQLKVSGD